MRAHHVLTASCVLLLLPSVCFAAPEQTGLVSTGVPFLDNVIAVVGALYILLSTISVFVPKDSKFGVLLAKIVADLKNRLEPTAEIKLKQAQKDLDKA